MKLAEALIQRKDLKERIKALADRMCEDALVQEGDRPTEDPVELLKQVNDLIAQHRDLVVRINETNLKTFLPNGRSLTEAIAERDALNHYFDILNRLASASIPARGRYSRNEIRLIPTVDVAEVRKLADRTGKAIRELDAQIQAVNWTAEI
jgi:methyl-accepting chemotaxis protein